MNNCLLKFYVTYFLFKISTYFFETKMWREEAFHHLRRSIQATQRTSLFTGYFISWDEKNRCATPLGKGWHYRTFQIFALFSILITIPIIVAKLLQLWTLSGEVDKSERMEILTEIIFTFLQLGYFLISLPMWWYFFLPSGPRRFVTVYHALLNLEAKLEGKFFEILNFVRYLHS